MNIKDSIKAIFFSGQYVTHHLFQLAYTVVTVAVTAVITSVIISQKSDIKPEK